MAERFLIVGESLTAEDGESLQLEDSLDLADREQEGYVFKMPRVVTVVRPVVAACKIDITQYPNKPRIVDLNGRGFCVLGTDLQVA